MSTLPLEVHDVLEEEYQAQYGAAPPALPSGARYTQEQFIDEISARSILAACGFDVTKNDALSILNDIVEKGTGIAGLELSPVLSTNGLTLVKNRDAYLEGKSDAEAKDVRRRIADAALSGAVQPLRDVRLGALYRELHGKDDKDARTALCISGGGIRSATFALGVIQGLAGAGLLDKFHYLSTVSGGGYIGSWLSSWARRHRDGMTGVQRDLVRGDTAVDGTLQPDEDGTKKPARKSDCPRTKVNPEAAPVRHLREYSNYLSPKLGITSADTWTIVALYIRNLLLNLLVLVPILAVILAFPRFFAWALGGVSYLQHRYKWVHAWELLSIAVAFIGVGFAYLGSTRPVEHGRKAERGALLKRFKANGRFILGCIIPLTIASTFLALFWARAYTDASLGSRWWFWANLGAAAVLMTLAPSIRYYSRVLKASAADRREAVSRDTSRARWRKFSVELFAAIVGIVTNFALLLILAVKIFDDPLKRLIDVKSIMPILRPLQDASPVSSVFLCLAVPLILFIFFVQASIFVGLSSKVNEDYDREWWGRAGAWLLMASVFLGVASIISVFGPVLLYRAPVILGSIGGVSGLLAGMVGYSSKTAANKKEGEKSGTATAASGISSALFVPLFMLILLAAISLGTTWVLQQFTDPYPPPADKWDAQFSSASAEKARVKIDNRQFEITTAVEKEPVVSVATSLGVAHLRTIANTEFYELLFLLDLALVAYLLSHRIGVNRFSMHAFYRNRLIRAYLGASRYNRDPDTFTGFDANDNLQMYELRSDLLWPSHFDDPCGFIDELVKNKTEGVAAQIWARIDDVTRERIAKGERTAEVIDSVTQHLNVIICDRRVEIGGTRVSGAKRAAIAAAFPGHLPPRSSGPMHVINTALNLTTGDNLAWQQRMAASFTVSPLHAGSVYVGYRDAREYGGEDGISIGNAVTISGAAASPNQGYNSSPALAFILTLLNVRLGSWLGNPGVAGAESYRSGHPKSNLGPLFNELTGSTNDTYEWIYLSDGGHFENLGVYEMILRRCRFIVVSDGGCDPKFTFEDLGNAIRKIRTDLGVPIDLVEELDMFPRAEPGAKLGAGSYMAKAIIRYSAIDAGAKDGTLVYLKPSVYQGDYVPRDVYNYAQESPEFPHETTADQWFSESQFESYRALGRHAINVICGNYDTIKKEDVRAPFAAQFASVAEFVRGVPKATPAAHTAQRIEVTTSQGEQQIGYATGDAVKIRIRPNA